MKDEWCWFIPLRARGQSISSYSLDPGDRWSSSFPRPLPAQPMFDYLGDPNPLHTDQSLFLLLKTQDLCGVEGLSFIHLSSQRRLPDHLVWARLCAGCLGRGCDGDRETFCDHQGESFAVLRIMCLDQGTCPGAHRGLLHGLVWRQDRLPHILYYLFDLSACFVHLFFKYQSTDGYLHCPKLECGQVSGVWEHENNFLRHSSSHLVRHFFLWGLHEGQLGSKETPVKNQET